MKKKPQKKSKVELYDSIGARSSAHILAASRAGRDIAPCPEIQDRALRDRCVVSLRTFLETCFPATFFLPWSADHLVTIARLEFVICSGGQFALAMPRGSGKSSIVDRAALWAVLTGRRRFVVLVGANESLAEQSLGRLKSELENNATLLALWPKAVYPIRRLESQARRCVGQLHEGARTGIVLQRKRLVLPAMPGPDNEATGAVLHVAGLTGAVRGLSHVDADGRTIRPDLLLVDDPQDRESAGSVVQTADRLAILNGDLLGLAGPNEKIAALATATIIKRGDLADQLLDRKKSPAWQGQRFKLVEAFPTNEKLWDEYERLRVESLRADGSGAEATQFYIQHRAEMDEGARVAWASRYNSDEVSAIQNAMNLRQDRGDEFYSEYQNEPREETAHANALDAASIAARCGGFARGIAAPECEKLTAFIDCGQDVLWWMVSGWAEDFSGHIVDFGCWPEQRARVFLARNVSPTLGQMYAQAGGVDGALYAGLSALVGKLLSREWRRSDGAQIALTRCLIDAGWATDTIRLFVRQSPQRNLITPSKGFGVGAGQAAIADYHKRPGERIGEGWILGVASADRLRLLRFDSNFWKSRIAAMLTRPMGMRGGVTLCGARPVENELLALHLSSEIPTRVEAKGRVLSTWARRPDRDNHWWDCLIGCAVAASVEGINPLSAVVRPPPARRVVSFAEREKTRKTWRANGVAGQHPVRR